jgi:hypothetical protein
MALSAAPVPHQIAMMVRGAATMRQLCLTMCAASAVKARGVRRHRHGYSCVPWVPWLGMHMSCGGGRSSVCTGSAGASIPLH